MPYLSVLSFYQFSSLVIRIYPIASLLFVYMYIMTIYYIGGAVPLFWRFSLLQIHFPGIFSMKFYQQVPLMDFMNHWTPESGTTETLGEFVPRCGFGDVSNLYLICTIWIMFKTEYKIRMYKLLRYTGLRIEIWLIDLHGWLISSYHHTVSISEHQWAFSMSFSTVFWICHDFSLKLLRTWSCFYEVQPDANAVVVLAEAWQLLSPSPVTGKGEANMYICCIIV